MWPTPTVMDANDRDCMKYAARILSGKKTRVSGEPVQITLSDAVCMDYLKDKPDVVEKLLKDEMKKRTKLPEQKEFVDYLRSQTNAKEISKLTDIKLTTAEHWFRYDTGGFSHPSVEDWNKIKPILKDIKYDYEITYEESIEWV